VPLDVLPTQSGPPAIYFAAPAVAAASASADLSRLVPCVFVSWRDRGLRARDTDEGREVGALRRPRVPPRWLRSMHRCSYTALLSASLRSGPLCRVSRGRADAVERRMCATAT
jgi:hypothetical protein